MIKKMCLFGIIFLLLASAVFAADLSEYPDMFMKGNRLNLLIVVGKGAAAEDVVGAIDIAASLMQASQQDEFESIARLDEEVLDVIYDYNVILVGGPCANTAAAKIMDYPANCNEGFEFGKAIIRLYDHGEHFALLVAGRTALDTRRATNVLSDYSNPNYAFEGTELVVEGVGSTLTGINVKQS